MSNDNERLSRELRDRANLTGGHPISLDDVKRSANKMKWQQRAAAGAVAAVVLAIAVPVGLAAVNGDSNKRPADPVATGGVETPTPTPTKTPDTDGKVELTLDVERGADPRISYLEGKTLHLNSGDTVRLSKEYDDVVSYHGGFLGYDVQSGTIDTISGNGEVTGSTPGSGFAVSVDGTEVAWYDGDTDGGQIKSGIPSGMGEGEATQDVPAGNLVTVLAYTPGSRLVYKLDDQNTGERTIWWTDFDGRATQIEGASGYGGYNNVTGQLALQTEVSDDGSCWALYSYGGGEASEVFGKKTCDYSLGEFSADGKYVIGWPAYGDGWGPGVVSILDAKTLKPVVEFTRDQDYGVSDASWDADDNSLIATVYLDGTWQLLRLGVDGTIEAAADGIKGDDLAFSYRVVDVR